MDGPRFISLLCVAYILLSRWLYPYRPLTLSGGLDLYAAFVLMVYCNYSSFKHRQRRR
jgi:hypothetical protein